MKLFFASDLHGSLVATQKVINRFEQSGADQLILLGDLLYHGPRNPLPEGYDPKAVAGLLNEYASRLISVRGNCDAEVDQMMLAFPCLADYAMVFADGYRFYITHGHLFDSEHLPPLSAGDIFVHGHFHVPMLEKKGSIVIVNPNSAALPKQGTAGYGIYENGKLGLYDLNTNEEIMTYCLKGDNFNVGIKRF